MTTCFICQEKSTSGGMCERCCKSYDRYSHFEAGVWGAIKWAAERARRFERRKQRKKAVKR